MGVCGYAAQALTAWVGGEAVSRLAVRFVSPATPGDRVVVDWAVTDGGAADEGSTHLAVTVHDGDETTFAEGTATVA
jgi:acyl-CoA thioesterase FadM